MTHYIIAYLATALVFFIVDFFWLTRIARDFYADRLGHLLLDKPNMAAAAGFYLIYLVGVVIFAVAPGLKAGSALTAAGFGALFGLFAYATYDMTNYATLRNWPLSVVIVDIAWGMFVTGLAAGIATYATQLLMRV